MTAVISTNDPMMKHILEQMERAEVVLFTDPEGNNLGVVKGQDILQRVIDSGVARGTAFLVLPVDCADTAEFITALYQVTKRVVH